MPTTVVLVALTRVATIQRVSPAKKGIVRVVPAAVITTILPAALARSARIGWARSTLSSPVMGTQSKAGPLELIVPGSFPMNRTAAFSNWSALQGRHGMAAPVKGEGPPLAATVQPVRRERRPSVRSREDQTPGQALLGTPQTPRACQPKKTIEPDRAARSPPRRPRPQAGIRFPRAAR